jgi:hypothetical protein
MRRVLLLLTIHIATLRAVGGETEAQQQQDTWDYGDADLNPWTWWPRAVPDDAYPPYVTGRRGRMGGGGGGSNDGGSQAARLVDRRGVTLPCVVDPFEGSTRLLGGSGGGEEEYEYEYDDGDGSKRHARCRQAYGSVFANYSSVLNVPSSSAVAAVLEELSAGPSRRLVAPSLAGGAACALRAMRRSEDNGESGGSGSTTTATDSLGFAECRVVSASKLDLKYTDDLGASNVALELHTGYHRFWYQINVGVLFFLDLLIAPPPSSSSAAAAPPTQQHRVGMSLTRTGQFSLFHHSALDLPGGDDQNEPFSTFHDTAESCSALAADETASSSSSSSSSSLKHANTTRPPLKLMTFNVWNVNPPK